MQRARVRTELGQIAEARKDAVAAQQALVGDPDDPTASAIGSTAAWILFRTAAPGTRAARDIVKANDTAISWWRMQHLAYGLTDALAQGFTAWCEDPSTRLGGQNAIHDRLLAAVTNAHLTGEQGEWRQLSSLLARNTLIAGASDETLTSALDMLRRSGDAAALTLAARRLWMAGPLGPLADAAQRIDSASWTHSAAHANLAL